jgi:hypothetical protein
VDRFLHIASCESAGGVIEETLRRLGRDEVVLHGADTFAEGPIHDVDNGARARVEWWSRVYGEPLADDDARELDDSDLWARIRAALENKILWHGPHPMERLFALRACWQLRDQPDQVYEVAIPPSGAEWPSGSRPAFYDSVPIGGIDATVRAWERRAKVTDVASRAKRWDELRANSTEGIRVLEGDEIVERPLTAHDQDLITACHGHWTDSIRVVALVLSQTPTGDALLFWRVRELLREGTLKGRGPLNRVGLPSEVRSATA